MTLSFYNTSIFETYNARHKSGREVAGTFVPPSNVFSDLMAKNNNIIVGPRGSGKTTLLKMLTLPALSQWPKQNSIEILPRANFVGIFIPSDRGWQSQIESEEDQLFTVSIGRIAFTTHVLLSFVQTLLEFQDPENINQDAVQKSPIPLVGDSERTFVSMAAKSWLLELELPNLYGLRLALRNRLIELKQVKDELSFEADKEKFLLSRLQYATLSFKECISFGIDCYEACAGTSSIAWGLLFDEFELAPAAIQKEVLRSLRGDSDTRIVYKIALAPYNESFINIFPELDSTPQNDYKVIELWYPDKNRGLHFSENLILKLLRSEGISADSLETVFGESEFDFPEHASNKPYEENGVIYKVFHHLAMNDATFAHYLKERSIDLNNWGLLTEAQKAPIRKVRSIAVARSYFVREGSKSTNLSTQGRSRKVHTLYTGYPTIMSVCEGNPRMLLAISVPLINELKILRAQSAKSKIDKSSQAEQVRLAIKSFRSLLKTIPYQRANDSKGKGLLSLLDAVGEFFYRKSITEPFSPEPPLSFTIPSHADENLLKALGRALNAGAIIYVPDETSDQIMSSIKGKRFRLNYLLAAYYKLPIVLGSARDLDSILSDARSGPGSLSLFGKDDDE